MTLEVSYTFSDVYILVPFRPCVSYIYTVIVILPDICLLLFLISREAFFIFVDVGCWLAIKK